LDKLAIEHLAALERLNRIITAFASMVSHETRSALVGVQGLSELIRDGGLTPEEVRTCIASSPTRHRSGKLSST